MVTELLAHSFSRTPRTIIVGTVYDPFHEQFETDGDFFARADRDIALMKESGINHVMVFPMGQWDPVSRRHLWTRTDYVIRKIEENGLRFVPVMLKEEQCASYLPIWKFKEIDGLWDQYALDNGRGNNRDNVDFADPRVYPLLVEYLREVIERYGKSPALSFYNIWNEPHYSSGGPHVIDRFRGWLQKKYGSLPALRRAWGEAYASWDQVSPFLAEDWISSMPQIDWTMFRSELNGILLEELIRSLRTYDTVHPVNANPVGTPWADFSNFGAYAVDSWSIAQRDDIHGISYYPDIWERDHALAPCPFWLHNMTFNTIRCSSPGREFIVTELFTNTQNGLALNGYLTKDAVSLLAWTALANDCKGLIYWQWLPFMRGRQALGRGLCRVDGGLASRGEAVKELGLLTEQHGELLYRGRLRKARAAILVDLTGLLKTLGQTTERATTHFMYESNAGVFKSLYEANITVDMLRMDRGIDLETLKSYRIIYLPFQIVMRREMAGLLMAYARQGGWVVADARCAMLDELDFAYETSPGAGLDELFGAVRPDLTGHKGYYNVTVMSGPGGAPLDFQGKYFKDQLRVRSEADVIGTFADDDGPAVIRHSYGSGTAILSAVPLGASYYDRPDNPVNRLLLEFAREAGVTPDARFASSDPGFVSVKVHDAGNDLILYVINAESGAMSGTLEVTIGDRRIPGVKDLLTGADVPFEQDHGMLAVPLTLNERHVMVLHVVSGRYDDPASIRS
jgi:beta-galactosidase